MSITPACHLRYLATHGPGITVRGRFQARYEIKKPTRAAAGGGSHRQVHHVLGDPVGSDPLAH
ncbi:MAG: hypothetical protein ACLP3C_32575, partial [Mycobacterium sp.]|uniref:hypothetical protein n=1 Tax=Mycobacterium sp. TaxID=1785 RepID=UPI003F9D129B